MIKDKAYRNVDKNQFVAGAIANFLSTVTEWDYSISEVRSILLDNPDLSNEDRALLDSMINWLIKEVIE